MSAPAGLTPGGWAILLLSISGVTSLFGWCLVRVLRSPPQHDEALHGMNIHTPDMDDGEDPETSPRR